MFRFAPTRRQVLLGSVATLLQIRAVGASAEPRAASQITLIFEGWGAPQSQSAVALFLDRRLPVAIVVDLAAPQGAPTSSDFASTSGLLEVLVPAPVLADSHRYVQMRAAGDLRVALSALELGNTPASGMIDYGAGSSIDFSAFRSAGFRVLIPLEGGTGPAPGPGGEVTLGPQGRSQLAIRGAQRLDADGKSDLVTQVQALVGSEQPNLIVISLDPMSGPHADLYLARLELLALFLDQKVTDGSFVMLRPTDHLLLATTPVIQPAALVIRVEPGTEASAEAFILSLDLRHIPFTLIGSPATLALFGRPADCVALDNVSVSAEAARARCISWDLPDAISWANELLAAEIVLHGRGADVPNTGLCEDGRFHATLRPWTILQSKVSPLDDLALLVTSDDYVGEEAQARVLSVLEAQMGNGLTRFWTISDWADYLLAPDPLRTRFSRARARLVTDPVPASPAVHTQIERLDLHEDARAAWAYIVNWTSPVTGLTMPTVQASIPPAAGAETTNVEATLWDLGSQLQGILAARSLGIIGDQESKERTNEMLDHLPVIKIGGARLPPSIFSIKDLRPIRRGFDVCDLGRFLRALDDAVEDGAVTKSDADAVWGNWDIGTAVQDRRFHSFRSRRWADITVSHCTDYILPPFTRRGYAMMNLFPETTGFSPADRDMAFLIAAARAGPYGAEPTLLELVEGGSSPAAGILADVLFDAQLSWFEQTGRYRSVSETPLNRPPWFVYQGLNLEGSGDELWSVLSIDTDERFATEEFRRNAEVIVAKSAYLWRAVRPISYSDALLSLVRDKCRVLGSGFCVGVYAETLEPLEGYYDINTNGIILTALNRILA